MDIAIFVVFLAINLFVGLSYGRNVKTIKDYALGGRNFSTAALVSTIVATFITGSGFFVNLSNAYSDGIIYVIASSCYAIGFFITAFFLIPKMAEFMGAISVAEVMGNLYGKHVRLITAISAILWNVGGIAVQFKVFGNLFNYFLGISSTYAIIIASTIVILYSAFGGIKAVTYTDVIQFFTFGFVIPTIAIVIWDRFHSTGLTIADAINNPLFDYHRLINLEGKELLDFALLAFYFAIPAIGPIHFQRISMGRNIAQVKQAWIIAAILLVLIDLVVMWIPFLILNINPNLEPTQVTSYIINNYANIGIIKGLIIIGVSAMAMSSADSFINGSAVLFGYDLKEVLNIQIDNVLLSRIFTVVLGGFAIYLALSTNDLLDMVMAAASFYIPIVTAPLVLAILGFRSTTKSVLIGMAAGFATVIIWKILGIKVKVIIFATLANLISFIGSHYLLKQQGGWVGVKDTEYLDHARQERARKISSFLNAVKSFNFLEFCKKNSPTNELAYMWLGIYFILYTLTTMYGTYVKLLEDGKTILTIYQIMMVTGTLMAMYPIWPPRIKYQIIVQIAWNITIFYMLTFFSCFFVLLSDFGKLQLVVFALNILITAVLVGWKIGFTMAVIGFCSSLQFYKYYTGFAEITPDMGSLQFVFAYTLILAGSALIIFFRPQQEYYALTEKRNKHLNGRLGFKDQELQRAWELRSEFIRNINHEFHTPLTGISTMAEVLKDRYQNLSDEQRLKAIETIYESSTRLGRFEDNLLTLKKLSEKSYELNLEVIDFSELVYERLDICRQLYEINPEDRVFTIDVEKDIILAGDRYYLTQVIDNLIINAIAYCQKGKIDISLSHDDNNVIFAISDEGIGIPPDELGFIFTEFNVSSKTRTPAGYRGVGLAVCKKVVEAHGGDIKAESNGEKWSRFSFTLPHQVT